MSTEQLASRIVRAMEAKSYKLDRNPGEVNIVYVEGVTLSAVEDGLNAVANGNKPNLWNDARIVLRFVNGNPVIAKWWQATTEPGTRYTNTPINTGGAARITLGQQRCWQAGKHRASSPTGHEALVQTGDVVVVTRDKNKDFSRIGDTVTKGFYGINQHHGGDAPENNIGAHSAGCLVGRTVAGHREFMALIKTDPRYLINSRFVFATTVLEAADIAESKPPVPVVPSRPDATAPVKMILKLTPDAMRKSFPDIPQAIVDAFASKDGTAALAIAGILDTPQRLAYCFANLAHEVEDFKLGGLTENINYTHKRAAEVWKGRFPGGASAVVAKYGVAPGWQRKMFDDVYGNRMENRHGTSDGSEYIGRGGPQITGRDGYREIGQRTGIDLENNPDLAALPEHQPAIAAAFWSWKGMNAPADRGDFIAVVRLWNGGTNGLPDRQAKLKRILPIAKSLARVPFSLDKIAPAAVMVAGTGIAANHVASQSSKTDKEDAGWGGVILIGAITLAVAVAAYLVVRWIKSRTGA